MQTNNNAAAEHCNVLYYLTQYCPQSAAQSSQDAAIDVTTCQPGSSTVRVTGDGTLAPSVVYWDHTGE